MSMILPVGCVSTGRKPQGYDRRMEILSTLPPGEPASISMLARDFRISRAEMVGVLNRMSITHGIKVDGETDTVSIPDKVKAKVRYAAAEYFERVWPD